MGKPSRIKVLLLLVTGTTLALGFNGCLETALQRILVGVVV
jgi:hypothetical protein